MDRANSLEQYLDAIPDPRQIKERLSVNLREARLLRRLLKLAEDKQVARRDMQGGDHAE